MLSNSIVKEDTNRIRKSYGMITESEVYQKHDVAKSVKTKEEIKISISDEIDSILFLFGIKKDWIKYIAPLNPSVWFSKEIELPYDIYAGAVISDLAQYIWQYDLTIESKEDFNPDRMVPVNLYAEIKEAGTKSENVIVLFEKVPS